MIRAEVVSTEPTTVEPSRIASGGSCSPTRTWKVRVTGSACGAISRMRPLALTPGASASTTRTSGSPVLPSSTPRRHGEDRIATILAGDLEDRLPGLDDLAGLGAAHRHHAGDIGAQIGEAEPVAGLFELGLGVLERGLGGFLRLLRGIEARARGEALPHQPLLPLEGAACGDDLTARGLQRRLGGGDGVGLYGPVEPGDDLPGRDTIPDIDRPLGHAAGDAEGERHGLLGLDLAGELDPGGEEARLDLDDLDGTARLGRRLLGAVAAGEREQQRQAAEGQERPRMAEQDGAI